MCLATQLFWLLLLSDSLCCKETEGSISSSGEYRSAVKPGRKLDRASSERPHLQLTFLQFTGFKPEVFQHLVSGLLK